jgi:hypothetical protein
MEIGSDPGGAVGEGRRVMSAIGRIWRCLVDDLAAHGCASGGGGRADLAASAWTEKDLDELMNVDRDRF